MIPLHDPVFLGLCGSRPLSDTDLPVTHTFPFHTLQVNRPLAMRKDGIQTRNRKVSSAKSKKRKGNSGDAAMALTPSLELLPPPLMGDEAAALYTFNPMMLPGHLLPFGPNPHLLGSPSGFPPQSSPAPHSSPGVISALV